MQKKEILTLENIEKDILPYHRRNYGKSIADQKKAQDFFEVISEQFNNALNYKSKAAEKQSDFVFDHNKCFLECRKIIHPCIPWMRELIIFDYILLEVVVP